jgi:cell division protein FtsW
MKPVRGTPDFLLLCMTVGLIGFGLVMVFSASSVIAYWEMGNRWYFTWRQGLSIFIGGVGMMVAMNIPYQVYRKLFFPIFLATIILLIIVLVVGDVRYGAKSWIKIGSFTLQPAEFAKIGLILYLAAIISKKEDKLRQFKKGLVPVLIITGFTLGLIGLQPDVGTAFILLCGALAVIYTGGARVYHLFSIAAPVLSLITFYVLQEEYRWKRITSFLDPWARPKDEGYQLIQSYYAMAHGGWTGAGFGQSIQKLFYLPLPHNDFIFSVIAEELGFIGAGLFLLFYFLFLLRGLIISLRCRDPFGMLVGIGIVTLITVQTFVNIGGVTGTIPITGVPLPFISYGGSSIMAYMVAIGILLSISREQNKTVERDTRPTARYSA